MFQIERLLIAELAPGHLVPVTPNQAEQLRQKGAEVFHHGWNIRWIRSDQDCRMARLAILMEAAFCPPGFKYLA